MFASWFLMVFLEEHHVPYHMGISSCVCVCLHGPVLHLFSLGDAEGFLDVSSSGGSSRIRRVKDCIAHVIQRTYIHKESLGARDPKTSNQGSYSDPPYRGTRFKHIEKGPIWYGIACTGTSRTGTDTRGLKVRCRAFDGGPPGSEGVFVGICLCMLWAYVTVSKQLSPF